MSDDLTTLNPWTITNYDLLFATSRIATIRCDNHSNFDFRPRTKLECFYRITNYLRGDGLQLNHTGKYVNKMFDQLLAESQGENPIDILTFMTFVRPRRHLITKSELFSLHRTFSKILWNWVDWKSSKLTSRNHIISFAKTYFIFILKTFSMRQMTSVENVEIWIYWENRCVFAFAIQLVIVAGV